MFTITALRVVFSGIARILNACVHGKARCVECTCWDHSPRPDVRLWRTLPMSVENLRTVQLQHHNSAAFTGWLVGWLACVTIQQT